MGKVKIPVEVKEHIRNDIVRLTYNRIRLTYSFAHAISLLVDSINSTMMAYKVPYSGEQRKCFTEVCRITRELDFYYEKLIEGPITECEGWEAYQDYRSDANEQIRLMMKFINAARTPHKRDVIFAVLDKLAEDEDKQLFRNEEIERFFMQTFDG